MSLHFLVVLRETNMNSVDDTQFSSQAIYTSKHQTRSKHVKSEEQRILLSA
jgi:hypothetical protein